MNELICPYCKSTTGKVIMRFRKGVANCKMYWIECSSCGIAQRHDDLHGYKNMKKAIDHWNTDDKDIIKLRKNNI